MRDAGSAGTNVFGDRAMTINLLELAEEIAEIARTTTDAETGMKLVRLAQRLLSEAGLPDENAGGGSSPGRRLSAPADPPGYA